jgi:hypothetical protein
VIKVLDRQDKVLWKANVGMRGAQETYHAKSGKEQNGNNVEGLHVDDRWSM